MFDNNDFTNLQFTPKGETPVVNQTPETPLVTTPPPTQEGGEVKNTAENSPQNTDNAKDTPTKTENDSTKNNENQDKDEVEEFNLSIGDTEENEVKTTENDNKAVAGNFDFKAVFGEEFDSPEKIKAIIKERNDFIAKQEKLLDLDKLDPRTKQAVDFIRQGGDISTYANIIAKDFDKISDAELARMTFDAIHVERIKSFTEEEKQILFDDWFKKSYGDEENDNENVFKVKQLQLKADLTHNRAYFKNMQSEALKNPQKEAIENDKKQFLDSIDTDAKAYKGLKIAFSKNEVLNFENKNHEEIRDFYINATPKQRNDAIMLYKNAEQVIKAAKDYGIKLGKQEVLKNMKNVSPKNENYDKKVTPQQYNSQVDEFLNSTFTPKNS